MLCKVFQYKLAHDTAPPTRRYKTHKQINDFKFGDKMWWKMFRWCRNKNELTGKFYFLISKKLNDPLFGKSKFIPGRLPGRRKLCFWKVLNNLIFKINKEDCVGIVSYNTKEKKIIPSFLLVIWHVYIFRSVVLFKVWVIQDIASSRMGAT